MFGRPIKVYSNAKHTRFVVCSVCLEKNHDVLVGVTTKHTHKNTYRKRKKTIQTKTLVARPRLTSSIIVHILSTHYQFLAFSSQSGVSFNSSASNFHTVSNAKDEDNNNDKKKRQHQHGSSSKKSKRTCIATKLGF